MYTSHRLNNDSTATPDAYDGVWLELLENPGAVSEVSDGPSSDPGSSFEAPGAAVADFGDVS